MYRTSTNMPLTHSTTSRIFIAQISYNFLVGKNQVSKKSALDSASKQPKSSSEVSDKTYRLLENLCKIIHSDIKLSHLPKLRMRIWYILFETRCI